MHRKTLTSVSALALIATAGMLTAGPLSPPAGPVTSTYKTLTEIEPRTAINPANTPGDATNVYIISQPGSYYLTGNMTVPSGKTGILITASNVSLDLSGFAITGQAGSVDGIGNIGNVNQVHVHDGSVVSMGGRGVRVDYALGMVVRNMMVTSCGSSGFRLASGSVAESCTSQYCATGFEVFAHCTLRDCSARDNSSAGFLLDTGSVAENCSAGFNTSYGFRLYDGALARGCTAEGNFGDGFSLSYNASAQDCFAEQNGGDGFHSDSACAIKGCSSVSNDGDGIEAWSRSQVADCYSEGNSGSGILLTGVYAAATGNSCSGNSLFGIRTTSASCQVTRNSVMGGVAGTTNFSLAVGTRTGPIVNAAGSAAIITVAPGGAAAGSFTTTDPNANLSY